MDSEELDHAQSPAKQDQDVNKLKKTLVVGKSKDGKRGVIYLSSIAPG